MTIVMPTDAGIPVLQGMALSHSLGQTAIDEMWRRGLPRLVLPLADWPLPTPPSRKVVEEILANPVTLRANDDLASALAAVAPAHDLLEAILAVNSSQRVFEGAKLNGFLSQNLRAANEVTSLRSNGNTPADLAANAILSLDTEKVLELLDDTVTMTAMIEQLGLISDFVKARSAKARTGVVAGVFPSLGDVEQISDFEALSEESLGFSQWTLRALRGQVLEAVSDKDPGLYLLIGKEIADRGRLLDPYVVKAVEAAYQAGLLSDDWEPTLSAFASARAEVVLPSDAKLLARPEVPQVSHKKSVGDTASGTQDDYLAALEVLGLGDAAARLAISAGNLAEDEFEQRIAAADVETIVDWAEKRLGQQPSPGRVAGVIDTLDTARQLDVLAEVARRPNPLELQPELALCLPKASELKVTEKSAVYVANIAQRAIGESVEGWSLACQLLTQGWSQSALEMIRSVEALAVNN